jgi:hypothetical protein
MPEEWGASSPASSAMLGVHGRDKNTRHERYCISAKLLSALIYSAF